MFLLFFSGIFPGADAQDLYPVNGKILIDNDDYSGISVKLTEGVKVTDLNVSSTGIFTVKLDWNRTYYFKFLKSGYVSKIVEFSTFIPDDRAHNIEPFYMNVRLFPVFNGVDTVFFKKPVAKVYYDKKINDFTDDRDYALKVVYHIEQMKKNALQNSSVHKHIQKKLKTVSSNGKKDKESNVEVALVEKAMATISVPVKDKKKKEKRTGNKYRYDIPRLKNDYPVGKTVETFFIDNKQITRVIIRSPEKQNVFIQVKHPWGGVFYFIDESPLGIFSVTEDSFRRYTSLSDANADRAGM